jgi:DNA-binding response OmpR family regulator
MDVVLVRYPAEAARRDSLAAAGVARLLLVETNEPPPEVIDTLEDWVRVPADELEVQARLSTLQARLAARAPVVPTLDADGVIRNGSAWVSLPPVEARLVDSLVERFGAVVSREVLTRAGWPEGSPGRNALDVHMLRVRRRLASVGLVIRTVRSRGYLLERAETTVASSGV